MIDAFLQAAEKELRNVSSDNRLSVMVTAIFITCNKEFWSKIESNIKIGGDAQQVLGNFLLFSYRKKYLSTNVRKKKETNRIPETI